MYHLYVGITAFPPGETKVYISWSHIDRETDRMVRVELARYGWKKEAQTPEQFLLALGDVVKRLERLVRGDWTR